MSRPDQKPSPTRRPRRAAPRDERLSQASTRADTPGTISETPEDDQHDDRDVRSELVGQPERADHVDERDDREGERRARAR